MKPRIPAYRNKSRRAKQRKAAQLYMYHDYSKPEACWATWLSSSKWNTYNATRAFKRKGVVKELEKIENAMVLREAKKKTEVVSEIETSEDELAKREATLLKLIDARLTEAGDDDVLAEKRLGKLFGMLEKVQKMKQSLGQRADKLQGRYVAEAKNPQDVQNDFIANMIKKQQEGLLNLQTKQAEAIDVEGGET